MGIGGSFVALGIVVVFVGLYVESPAPAIAGGVVIGLGGSAMIGGGVTYGIGRRDLKRAQREWKAYKAGKQVSIGAGGFTLHF